MADFSEDQQDEIIRAYLGPDGSEENPRCPFCGEVLQLTIDSQPQGLTSIKVRCPDCKRGFSWQPKGPEGSWKSLHLDYFLECHQLDQTLRCPFDDCYVIATEFSDGMLEFRCPYCNRRGRTKPFNILIDTSDDEDESSIPLS